MQYKSYYCSVTNGSNVVTGHPSVQFISNARAGNSFKVAGDPVIYQISAVVSKTVLNLSTPFAGVTNATAAYQITTDYTTNLGLAEINAGDQDWAQHLTQEVIRKLDMTVGTLISNGLIFKDGWNATTGKAVLTSAAVPAAAAGNIGWMYQVTISGTFNLNGNALWYVGDSLVSNGSTWVRIPGAAYDELLTMANNIVSTQATLAAYIAAHP